MLALQETAYRSLAFFAKLRYAALAETFSTGKPVVEQLLQVRAVLSLISSGGG